MKKNNFFNNLVMKNKLLVNLGTKIIFYPNINDKRITVYLEVDAF